MKSWAFAVLVGAGVAVVSLSGACASERQVTVSNTSAQVVVDVFAAPTDSGDYRDNLLGSANRIQAGGSAQVTVDTATTCVFDFQAFTGDDDMLMALKVDVCAGAEAVLR